jgi:hypothetical protein
VAKILDQIRICCYPQPLLCITDNGNEFLGTEFQELLGLYKVQHITTTWSQILSNSSTAHRILDAIPAHG